MNKQPAAPPSSLPAEAERKLTPQAQRALDEAAERRRLAEKLDDQKPKEVGGQSGPDPTRFGDWEKKGIVSDF